MLFRHVLRKLIKIGRLTVIDAEGKPHLFQGVGGPEVTIRIRDRSFDRRLFLNPHLAVGEAYMDGMLTIEEGSLYDFLDIGVQNVRIAEYDGPQRILQLLRYVRGEIGHYNPIGAARRRVSHHYDLKDELFDLFLDRDRQYSCAYFASDNDSLETAQERKKAHIARKLLLSRGQRVLDIGSGWGGLGLHIARTYDADVSGVTLSHEQHRVSNERARAAGLDGRVRFHLRDYRQETGTYDRVVSVGMLEHVGRYHYKAFFKRVADLLTPNGVALIHTIGRYDDPGPMNAWMQKYIFPGSYVPTMSELMPAIEKSGLLITDLEVLKLHYARTLLAWRRNFLANIDKARELYDDRFCRMWEFYLTACEIGFRRKELTVFQIQLAKEIENVPETRAYMYQERARGASA